MPRTHADATIADLHMDGRNARRRGPRASGLLEASLQEVGAARSIVIDEDNRILAGNGTVEAAGQVGIDRVQIVEADGETIIAVRRRGLTEAQKQRLALLDNRTADLAEWDPQVLAALVDEGLQMGDLWSDAELEAMIAADGVPVERGDGGDEFDATPDADMPARSHVGDVWQCGPHRVVCGDCTDPAVVSRLMGHAEAECYVYDPPWDAAPTVTLPRCGLVFGDGATVGQIVHAFGPPTWVFAWDCVTSWYTPNRPLRRMKLAAWYGDIERYNSEGAHYGDAGQPRQVSNSRGSYWFTPDERGKHLSDVWQQPITQLHADGPHPHEKPIDWVTMLIGNCTSGLIYDPFMGSGTTLIAAHRLGRTCIGCEIDPRYVDVILRRWEAETGEHARRID